MHKNKHKKYKQRSFLANTQGQFLRHSLTIDSFIDFSQYAAAAAAQQSTFRKKERASERTNERKKPKIERERMPKKLNCSLSHPSILIVGKHHHPLAYLIYLTNYVAPAELRLFFFLTFQVAP